MAETLSPPRVVHRLAWLVPATPLLAACAVVSPPTTGHSRLYVGAVRISTPLTSGPVTVTEVQAVGIGFEDGAWLGWRKGSWVSADPAKCQLLVIIRSGVEAAQAAHVFKLLGGTSPCIVDQSQQ